MSLSSLIIFDFSNNNDLKQWRVVDDVVMGGRSNGSLTVNSDGSAVFSGRISLENNGGFSSVRHQTDDIKLNGYSQFKIRLKGDGKPYQFRCKANLNQRHSYSHEFETTGHWQTITIPFNEMAATFRGYRLDIPNFEGKLLSEIAFLIGNKKEESFTLVIDKIYVE